MSRCLCGVDDLPKVVHVEEAFDDFALQPLLPMRLSKLGPGIACADVNGDGLDDFYLAGAKGMVGQLLLGDGRGFMTDSRSDSMFRNESIVRGNGPAVLRCGRRR